MLRFVHLLVYLTLLLGGTYLAYRPTFETHFRQMQTDIGDTVLNHYILEHSFQALFNPNYCGTLLSPPFYHPQELVLGYSENLLGTAPLYWALRAVCTYDLAFQWWMILCGMLNFVTAAAVARRLGCPPIVAAFAGFLWAFSLVHVYQVRHQQMIPRLWCPVAAYYAWRLALEPSVRSLHRMVAACFLQTACCIYTGWFLVLGIAVFLPFALSLRPGGWIELRAFYTSRRTRILLVLGVWACAFGAFFLPYFLANRGVSRGYSECVPFLPNGSTWVCGPEDSWWFRTIGPFRESVSGEAALFCGPTLFVLLMASAIWAFRRRHSIRESPERLLIAACLLTTAFLVITTMAFWEGLSGWYLLRLLPGGGAIRVVARVYVPIYLFANIAVVLTLAVWLREERSCLARTGYYLLVTLVVFEQTGHTSDRFDKPKFYGRVERCAEALKGAELGFITGDFGPDGGFQPNLLGMWAGLRANVPVANGYSGRSPPGYKDHGLLIEEELIEWLKPRYRGRVRFIDSTDPNCQWETEITEYDDRG